MTSSDLLKRHAANHPALNDDNESESGEPTSKRRKTLPNAHRPRAVQACRACAASKLRCEGSKPCLRCKEKSLACEYPQSQSARAVDSSSVEDTTVEQHDQLADTTEDSQMDRRISQGHMSEPTEVPGPSTSFQLPTPMTFGQGKFGSNAFFAPTELFVGFDPLSTDPMFEQDMMLNFDSMPLVDFLRDPHIAVNQPDSGQVLGGDDVFPRDVLDFGVDLTLDMPNIFDGELQSSLDHQLMPPPLVELRDQERTGHRSGLTTPGLRGNINIIASAQAFKESLWLWTPEKEDHGALEQLHLSLPWEGVSPESQPRVDFPVMHQSITNAVRGQILAMVLRTCESVIYSHVVSNFPSAELLTNLVHNFVSFHVRRDMSWIHPATIQLSHERPEFLAGMICYGAAISQVPEIRKLGFAMQEAVRVANPLEVSISYGFNVMSDVGSLNVTTAQPES